MASAYTGLLCSSLLKERTVRYSHFYQDLPLVKQELSLNNFHLEQTVDFASLDTCFHHHQFSLYCWLSAAIHFLASWPVFSKRFSLLLDIPKSFQCWRLSLVQNYCFVIFFVGVACWGFFSDYSRFIRKLIQLHHQPQPLCHLSLSSACFDVGSLYYYYWFTSYDASL